MPLHFQAKSDSSFDPVSGVTIPEPRILPGKLPDGSAVTEYQYAFYRGDARIGGLGFNGPDMSVEVDGMAERVFIFDLGHDWLIKSMLEFKEIIENQDDDYTFLRGLAQGLVLAYAGQTDNEENLRYIATTTPVALVGAGVPPSVETAMKPQGPIVLAEVRIAKNAG